MATKRIIVSGASGILGRFIVEGLLAQGHEVLALGRHKPAEDFFSRPVAFKQISLADMVYEPEDFLGYDGFVHTAFHHERGKYRGGEGDKPEEFQLYNHDGSMALFNAVKRAGVERAVFLSSRAVYGVQEAGACLVETIEPKPDTLYGFVKLRTEQALCELSGEKFLPIILRATGVYGPVKPPLRDKWQELFDGVEAGKKIAPRVGTEVHGEDLAGAINTLLAAKSDDLANVAANEKAPIFNLSDILLDRRELLGTYAKLKVLDDVELPAIADASTYNAMDCSRLKALGWQPRGILDLSYLDK